MKEKRSFKRFDLMSSLAVFGVLLLLLFESFFIFEFYRVDYKKIEPYLPGILKAWFEPPPAATEEAPAPAAEKPTVDAEPSALVPGEAPEPAVEEPVPEKEEAAPVEEQPLPSEEDPAPVG